MTWTRRFLQSPPVRLLLFAAFTLLVWLLLAGRPGLGDLIDSEAYVMAMRDVAPALALILLVLLVERRAFSETGFGLSGALRDGALGLAVGAGAMALTAGLMAAFGGYRVGSIELSGSALWTGLGAGLLHYLGVAIFEEALTRGGLQRLAEEWLGSWAALIATALVFGWAHTVGTARERLFLAVIGGLLYGACYLLTRSLWMPIGAHLAWNFSMGNIFGMSVSGGNDRASVIEPTLSGPDLLTGGTFGAEGSVIAVVVCGAIALWLLYLAHRRGRIRPPVWVKRADSFLARKVMGA